MTQQGFDKVRRSGAHPAILLKPESTLDLTEKALNL